MAQKQPEILDWRGGELQLIGWIIIAMLLLAAIIYNLMVTGRQRIQSAWSQIDVQLKRRHDLIPDLVAIASGYMAHEEETLTRVIQARQAADTAGISSDLSGRAAAERSLSASLHSFWAVAENYPKLEADRIMMTLQEELLSTENRIAFARQYYNDEVMRYNTLIESFPASIIAGIFNFARNEFFELPAGEDHLTIEAHFKHE